MSDAGQLIEVCGLLTGEPVEAQVIQDQQVRAEEGAEGAVYRSVPRAWAGMMCRTGWGAVMALSMSSKSTLL